MTILFSIWFGFYLGMPGTAFINNEVQRLEEICASLEDEQHDTHFTITPKESRNVQYTVNGIRYMSNMKGYTLTCVSDRRK